MKFVVEKAVVDLFPKVIIGIVKGSLTEAEPDLRERIGKMREEAVERLKTSGLETGTLSDHPHMAAWRAAYQKFGVKAKTHKPTHEALARRLLKGDGFPEINPIVDIYLTNQAAVLLPHGGYDHPSLNGTLRLAVSPGDERFEPLGGGEEVTSPGEVVYRDDVRIVTRRWNYRDCEVTKITDQTKHFVLMVESPSGEVAESAVTEAMRGLVERYTRCFQGTFVGGLFKPTAENNMFEL